jgi:hypothetical protein
MTLRQDCRQCFRIPFFVLCVTLISPVALGQVALVLLLHVGYMQKRLVQEYLTHGVLVDGYFCQCQQSTDDYGVTQYESVYQYRVPSEHDDDDNKNDNNNNNNNGCCWYQVSDRCWQKDAPQHIEIGSPVDILVLPGIPQSGLLRDSLSRREQFERCFGLQISMVIYGLLNSAYIVVIFSSSGDQMFEMFLATVTLYLVLLILVYVGVALHCTRSLMVNTATRITNRDEILPVVLLKQSSSTNNSINNESVMTGSSHHVEC